MTPEDYERAQRRLSRRLANLIVPRLLPFVGARMTSRLVDALIDAIFPGVNAARDMHRTLAQRQYEELKAAELPDTDPIERPELREYNRESLAEGLKYVVPTDREFERSDVQKIVATAEKHARTAGRNQLMAYALHDESIIGWARVDPFPPTCAFCRMLISRGPVYNTARSAGESNAYHKGCTCQVTLVFETQRDSWPGRDQYLQERRRWADATKGKSGEDAFKAFRRAVSNIDDPA